MAPLEFHFHGYIFQSGVDVLLKSFTSAVTALNEEVERAAAESHEYRRALEQGAEWVGEVDDEGYVIWDQVDVLDAKVIEAREALMGLCKAFVLALYHQWERSIREWTGSGAHSKHDTLARAVRARGVETHPRLDAVRDLVNALKHNSDAWGEKLVASWSDVFPPDFRRPPRTDWYYAIQIREEHVFEAFNIVAASGPTIKTTEAACGTQPDGPQVPAR